MLNLYTDLLLGMNLLAVLYLVVRMTGIRGAITNQQEFENRWHKKNRELTEEVAELREAIEKSNQIILDEFKQLKQEGIIHRRLMMENSSSSTQHLLLNDRYKEIFELKEQGFTAKEIAKKLGKGYGEVIFILDLANQEQF